MRKVALLLLLCGSAVAAERSVCLEDRVGLSQFSRRAFESEFRTLVDVDLRTSRCSFPAVSLVVSAHPPARYASALGLAHTAGGRVLPELRIYTGSVLRILGQNASAAQIGRALARIAAHELGHYFRQQLHHEEKGLMAEAFNPSNLTAVDHARTESALRSEASSGRR